MLHHAPHLHRGRRHLPHAHQWSAYRQCHHAVTPGSVWGRAQATVLASRFLTSYFATSSLVPFPPFFIQNNALQDRVNSTNKKLAETFLELSKARKLLREEKIHSTDLVNAQKQSDSDHATMVSQKDHPPTAPRSAPSHYHTCEPSTHPPPSPSSSLPSSPQSSQNGPRT